MDDLARFVWAFLRLAAHLAGGEFKPQVQHLKSLEDALHNSLAVVLRGSGGAARRLF